jgi:oligoribonuclease (3'-5' exoribonuclease)
MTGLEGYNATAFNAAADAWRAAGWDVFNPAENTHDPPKAWIDYILPDIDALFRSDAIALLPGWSTSNGARIELQIATNLGLRIFPEGTLPTPPSPLPNPRAILWCDLETTGADPATAAILEAAFIYAPDGITPTAEYHAIYALPPRPALEPDAKTMHLRSGLYQAAANADLPADHPEAEQALLAWASATITEAPIILGGSGVASFDRPIIARVWPAFTRHFLHYRTMDVSGLRRFFRATLGHNAPTRPPTPKPHRALADARLAMADYTTYRSWTLARTSR